MTKSAAMKAAARRSKREIYFVVFEDGEYDAADEYDLETYYAGLSDQNIIAAFEDGQLVD